MAVYLWLWGDTSLGPARTWGNGDLWNGATTIPVPYLANQEVTCHRLSLVINKTGSTEFVIHRLTVRLATISQSTLPFIAFVDKVTPSEFLSVKISRVGAEFIVSRIQIIASRKKHQPVG